MPWMEVDKVSLRQKFIATTMREGSNISEICRSFCISPKTGYKWIERFNEGGSGCFKDRSRRPINSPNKTPLKVEEAVLGVREKHPTWGCKKIRATLLSLNYFHIPSASTITEILRRNGKITKEESMKRKAWQRFEYKTPNDLWQMDFKGDFKVSRQRCFPLVVIDDHSRFSISITACSNQRQDTVKPALIKTFRCYGVPSMMLMDNGSPWGHDYEHQHTVFTVWLMRVGIKVIHGRPYHPQTQGKTERFNRTLKEDVIKHRSFNSLVKWQLAFDSWRNIYNNERPHEALGLEVPASRYKVSEKHFPENLPPINYEGDCHVRMVDGARISFKGKLYRVGKAFNGLPVALSQSSIDGIMNVHFMKQKIKKIDLRSI